jgi:hypothetical protein
MKVQEQPALCDFSDQFACEAAIRLTFTSATEAIKHFLRCTRNCLYDSAA